MEKIYYSRAFKSDEILESYSSKELMLLGIPENHHECIMREWCNKYKTLGCRVELEMFDGSFPRQIIFS